MIRILALLAGLLIATAAPAHADYDAINGGGGGAPMPIEAIITQAASNHGVDPGWMIRIARCESSLNPRAVNGRYLGLYQLGYVMQARFHATGHADLWDAGEQADFAAEQIAAGNARAWSCA